MTLTTTQAHDVLVLLAVAEKPASGPPAVSTVTSTSGLTWNKRKAFTPTPGVTDIEVWWAYAPSAVTSEVITVTYNMTIDDFSLTGSYAKAGTAATASTTFSIKKNGSSIGSLNFAAGATSGTFTFTSAVTTSPGDVVQVVAPASPDATLANINLAVVGTR